MADIELRQLNNRFKVLYPYFKTNELAQIFGYSPGWTNRKINEVIPEEEKRTAGETRNLPKMTTMELETYTTLVNTIRDYEGELPYQVRSTGESIENVGSSIYEDETDEELDELSSIVDELVIMFEQDGEDEEETREPSAIELLEDVLDVGQETTTDEVETHEEEPIQNTLSIKDLMKKVEDEVKEEVKPQTKPQTIKEDRPETLVEAYTLVERILTDLGNIGVFGHQYELNLSVLLDYEEGIRLTFNTLQDMRQVVNTGVEGVDWELVVKVDYTVPTRQMELLQSEVEEKLESLRDNIGIETAMWGTGGTGQSLSIKI